MQVDLFSSGVYDSEIARLRKQIETRKFRIQGSLDGLGEHLQEYPEEIVQGLINRYSRLATKEREYFTIGAASSDSHWELEALGLGNYMKEWVVTVDFTDCLDLAMKLAYGCSTADLRQIPGYKDISRSLLSYEFDNSDIKLGVLFTLDERVNGKFLDLYRDVSNNNLTLNMTIDEKMAYFVYVFYAKILESLADARDYIVAELQNKYQGQMVYRSRSFSMAILTSDVAVNDIITIKTMDGEEFSVEVKSYKRYEWIKDGVINEINRKVGYWK